MSSFFTSGFARKRAAAGGGTHRNASNSTSVKSSKNSAIHAEKSLKDSESSWYSLQDREGRPYWWNSITGDKVYRTPVAPSCNHHLTTSPMLMAQPFPSPGYPLHIAAPAPYPAVYHTPVAPSCNQYLTTSPMLMAQSFPTPGYPLYIAAPGPNPAVHQPFVILNRGHL